MADPHAPVEYRQHRFRLPPGAADLLLVRHGESQPARLGEPFDTVDGQADPPLDPRGHTEGARVADRLVGEDVAAIYVTPLRRTAQTAAPLAARLGLEPRVVPELREVHLGEWEGATFRARVAEGHPIARQLFAEERWEVIPGAESGEAFAARVRAGITRIAAAHPDQRVVVYTHGGVIGMVVGLATGGRPFAFVGADNGSLTHLVVSAPPGRSLHDRHTPHSRASPPHAPAIRVSAHHPDTGGSPDAGAAGAPAHWTLRRFNDTGHLATDLDRPTQPLT
ncbi:MAG: histidine phosphatase family protein [Egibacteraceae bacterium]